MPSVEQQWRSGVGVTPDGALVYATGPSLTPLQLAQPGTPFDPAWARDFVTLSARTAPTD